jgi:hypothetical protein
MEKLKYKVKRSKNKVQRLKRLEWKVESIGGVLASQKIFKLN